MVPLPEMVRLFGARLLIAVGVSLCGLYRAFVLSTFLLRLVFGLLIGDTRRIVETGLPSLV